jgi:hypothetical protein
MRGGLSASDCFGVEQHRQVKITQTKKTTFNFQQLFQKTPKKQTAKKYKKAKKLTNQDFSGRLGNIFIIYITMFTLIK